MNDRCQKELEKFGTGRSAKFVLKYGRSFIPTDLPKEYRHGEMGNCYKNSALMSFKHKLTYVEGFATVLENDFPTLHAWCIDDDGNVLDRTWAYTGKNSYFGVPIKDSYIKIMYKKSGYYGVIDRYELNWPITREEPSNFLAF